MLQRIPVHGARQHNLKNIDVEIPRNSLTVITKRRTKAGV
jgi:excinuclease ABC subunit A